MTYGRQRPDALLIVAPLSAAARYGPLRSFGNFSPPQGLLSIIASLRAKGLSARLLDADAAGLDIEQTARCALELRPRAVGISAVTMAIGTAGALAAKIKDAASDTFLFCGGAHPSALPEDTLRRWPAFDAAVFGEGETTALELVSGVCGRIDGAVIRQGSQLVKGAARPLISELDSLPDPAWDALGELGVYRLTGISAKRRSALGLISMRGCPFDCAFCSHVVFGRRSRMHGPHWLMRNLGLLRSRGVHEVQFNDEDFLLDPQRARLICERMIEARQRWAWSISTRPDGLDENLLRLAKRAGLWQVALGIESGSQRMLDLMDKGISLGQIEESVRALRRVGLEIKAFFMIGFPGEDAQSLELTKGLAMRLPRSVIQVAHFVPLPGTRGLSLADPQLIRETNWDLWSGATPVYLSEGLKREDLDTAYRMMLRSFYCRPRFALGLAWRLISRGNLSPLWRGALSMLRLVRAGATHA